MAADSITCTLAHPVSALLAATLGVVDSRDYRPGEQITVPRDQVMRLVNAGLVAGVDPNDLQAVRQLLGGPSVEPVPGAESLFTFTHTGILSPFTGTLRFYNDAGRGMPIQLVRATVATPPVGAGIRVNVRANGNPIFPTAAAQPTIPDGGRTITAVPSAVTLPAGGYLTIDVDTVGTTTPGSDLLVTVVAG